MSNPVSEAAANRVANMAPAPGAVASDSAGLLVSHLAHELRTPLHGVLGFAQLMFRDVAQPLDPQQLRHLSLIESAGHDMLALLDDVLCLSRAQLDAPAPLVAVDLAAALYSAADDALAFAQPRDVDVSLEVPELDARVRANPDSLHRAILNLLCHAIAATDDHGVVHVSVLRRPGWFRLVVTDDGPSLGEERPDALLEPFGLRGGTRSSTGLGLAVSRALVEQMGGTTRAWSKACCGCSIEVELASWHDHATEPVPASVPDARPPSVALRLPVGAGPVRILYVEDDRLNSLLVKSALAELHGCELEFAESGAEAWAIIEARQPDVVLSDLNLPGGGGLELVRRIRSDALLSDMVCIAISADAGAHDAALHAGFDRFWSKPVDLHTMLDTVRRLCHQRALQD